MGLFITFEGIEGCGKSTQIQLLAAYLAQRGITCTLTREPGGTPIGEAIRGVFLKSSNTALTPLAELLLVTAARVQHLQEVIMPALASGAVVLCDRFFDATAAYQGYGGGIDLERIRQSHEIFCSGIQPDLTLLLDCPVELGLARSRGRNKAEGIELAEGRFEDKDVEFHGKVRQGYLELARREPGRFCIIDATAAIAGMQEKILACAAARLREKDYAV